MPRETDLLRVKLVAHTLLDVQIQETALSPVIVSHPFTSSGISALRNEDGSLSMVDLINNSDDCTRWRRKVGEQIDSAENVHQIFVLLNPPYYLTFYQVCRLRSLGEGSGAALIHRLDPGGMPQSGLQCEQTRTGGLVPIRLSGVPDG